MSAVATNNHSVKSQTAAALRRLTFFARCATQAARDEYHAYMSPTGIETSARHLARVRNAPDAERLRWARTRFSSSATLGLLVEDPNGDVAVTALKTALRQVQGASHSVRGGWLNHAIRNGGPEVREVARLEAFNLHL